MAQTDAEPSQAAQLEVRISQLEEQIRDLTGRVETDDHQIQVLTQQLEKMRADTELRLSDLEAKTGGRPAGASPPAASPAAPAPPPDIAGPAGPTPLLPGEAGPPGPPTGEDKIAGILGTIPAGAVPSGPPPAAVPAPAEGAGVTPQRQYQAAFDLVGQGHYAEAEKAFRTFVAQHPKDPLAGSAAYWLGETYYVRGDFTNAAVSFGEAYRKYPSGTKAPDTLLKLGLSLAQLNRKEDACTTFSQLGSQFPNASPSVKRQAQQEKTRLKCA